jgi:ATP-dependent RNA circularization protein (DNA/RNA ligase family)
VRYDALPDWFLVFDIYQRSTGRFWPISLRDEFAKELGLHVAPFLGAGRFDEGDLVGLIGKSRVGHGPMEGVVARVQDSSGALQRAKIVRSDFVQQIDQHWMSGSQAMNRLATL